MAENTETVTFVGEASQGGMSRGKNRLAIIAALACIVVGATFGYNVHGENASSVESLVEKEPQAVIEIDTKSRRKLSGYERLLQSEPEPEDDATKEDVLIEKIAKKLEPVGLRFYDEGEIPAAATTMSTSIWQKKDAKKAGAEEEKEKPTMVPHQFLHLHHMKTGGTSIDRLLRCSMDRLKKEANFNVPYYNIHECSRNRFAQCLIDPENSCREKMEFASVMSYCAALKYLDEFGWWHEGNTEHQVKAMTVLRHPVDRVWSMYRFQTKNCYKCQELKDIYKMIENGEDSGVDKLCLDQLQNHEVNNLLSTEWPLEVTQLDFENNIEHLEMSTKMVQEAVDNMKGFFTVIGITERLPETADIIGKTFPWMSLEANEEYGTTSECELPHANASPKNNRCGADNTHWELPKQPDQETYDLILKHNALDMELYEAAEAYFELQVKALKSAK